MPIADFKHYTNDGSEMTEMDAQHSRLIGALMACAKHLQVFNKCVTNGDADQGAVCSVEMLICLRTLYGSDGQRMEREALALARRLGFSVEQYNIPPASGGVSH